MGNPTPPADSLAMLHSLRDVANLLDTSQKQLAYLLYGRHRNRIYATFQIPKRRGGFRTIEAPRDDLKVLQRRFAGILYSVYKPRKVVHGFALGQSVATNAARHVRKRYVFNVDLEKFFPSINFGRVRGLFMAQPLNIPERGATILAQLCCHCGALPQGAPTSPIVSNMVCARLDRQLTELARSHSCVYTRYADDITFSKARAGFPAEVGYLDENKNAIAGSELRQIIESNGFRINTDKVRLYTNTHRQTVTGLTVNSKRNVSRRFIRQIRAMVHAWDRYGLEAAQLEHARKYYRRQGKKGNAPPFEKVLRGKLEFVKMVRGIGDLVYRNLQRQFVKICPDYLSVMIQENEQMSSRDVFISHASEDKDAIARPLAEALVAAGFSVWFDEYEIRIGDSLRQKIDDGLASSRYGVVILSKNFFAIGKKWTRRELDGLTASEDADGRKRILPVWYRITHSEVAKHSPTLAGLKALVARGKSIEQIVGDLAARLKV